MAELGEASFRTYKLGNLGEVIFRQLDSGNLGEMKWAHRMLKLSVLGEVNFRMFELGDFGESIFRMLKLGKLSSVKWTLEYLSWVKMSFGMLELNEVGEASSNNGEVEPSCWPTVKHTECTEYTE